MPYVRYHFTDIVSLQLGWENLEGRTKTLNVTALAPYPHSNGNVELSGPSVTVLGRYPLPQLESVTPYAGLGLVFFSGNFAMDPDWHENGRRYMESDDETGILATLGASVRIYEQFEADLSLSYIRARPSARYRLWIDDGYSATWEFPMDSWVYQLGLKYAF
jgi:outer membrane protein W